MGHCHSEAAAAPMAENATMMIYSCERVFMLMLPVLIVFVQSGRPRLAEMRGLPLGLWVSSYQFRGIALHRMGLFVVPLHTLRSSSL